MEESEQTILIVDDSEDVRALLKKILEEAGYRVLEAKNGKVALEAAKENSIDLIFLDILMPVMDGFEFCHHLREELGDHSTYIIALSAKNEISNKVQGLQTGVDVYFGKSFYPEELLAQVKVGIQTTRQRRHALVDPLTFLPNRKSFNSALKREFGRAERYGVDLVLAIFDIDHFKSINDQYGHQVGDDILVSFARLIESNIRTCDFFSRWGGDEFVLILPNTNTEGALIMLDKVRKLVEQNDFPSVGKGVHCSIGFTQFEKGHMLENFFQRADNALIQAKCKKRNCVIQL